MSQLPPAGGRATRPPGPLARTVQADAKLPAWSGAEGECVLDPVTPGVLWLGGARGGSRVAGLAHVPPEAGPNGGDVACAPGNLAFRDTTLAQIEARTPRGARLPRPARPGAQAGRAVALAGAPGAAARRLGRPWAGPLLRPLVFPRARSAPTPPSSPATRVRSGASRRPAIGWRCRRGLTPIGVVACRVGVTGAVGLTGCVTPTRVSPLDEAGGDPNKVRELTYNDVLQCVRRCGARGAGALCGSHSVGGFVHTQVVAAHQRGRRRVLLASREVRGAQALPTAHCSREGAR